MKKYFLTSFLILTIVASFSCDKIENRFLYIKNDSKSAVSCFITKRNLNLVKKSDNLKGDRFLAVGIKANREGSLSPGKSSWERFIEECEGNKLHFYVASQDSIYKYGVDSVFEQNMYIKKEDFTIEDLEKINFHITL